MPQGPVPSRALSMGAQRIWALVVKEFLAIWKDRRSRLVLVVPPIVQTLVFAYAATFDVTAVPLGLWIEDGGGRASELVQRFADSSAFHPVASFARPQDVADAITEQKVVTPSSTPRPRWIGRSEPAEMQSAQPRRLPTSPGTCRFSRIGTSRRSPAVTAGPCWVTGAPWRQDSWAGPLMSATCRTSSLSSIRS